MRIFLLVPNFNEEKKSIMNVRARQPLSMAIIASMLKNSGHGIKLLDANVLNLSAERILQAIFDFAPEALIATSTPIDRWECPNSNIENIFKLINQADVKYKILAGSHGTTMPEWVFDSCKIDFIIRGEPELAAEKLIAALSQGGSFSGITGLSYRDGGKIINNPIERITYLDALPLPAYDLLPMDRYSSNDYAKPFSIIMASRGCPFNCVFCLKAMMPGQYVVRGIDKVIEEVELLINKYQVRSIFFQDWEFFIDSGRVEQICEALIGKGLKLSWGANARATDIIKCKEIMPLVKKAGCVNINLGMESASNRVLTAINKRITQDDLQQAIGILKASGISGGYCVLLNAPGENTETIKETVDFIAKNDLQVKQFLPVIPYPGTILFDRINKMFPNKKINWNNIEKYAGLIDTGLKPFWSMLYLRNYKHRLKYGRGYFLKPIFWREVVLKKII
ncbi:MAG: radical SAM protein [Candidatus Buchananbacteria bacterium]